MQMNVPITMLVCIMLLASSALDALEGPKSKHSADPSGSPNDFIVVRFVE
jgi:hypothetical protein